MNDTAGSGVVLDAFGLTDRGLVRPNNEDHFLVAEVRKTVTVSCGSLPAEALINRQGASGAHLLLVADGVGGGPDGDVASERSAAAVLSYVGSVSGCFHALDATQENDLLTQLESAVQHVHESLVQEASGTRARAPATTLTLLLLVWPRAYLIHVGDSRAYVRRRGRTQRLTRDQNFGEIMVAAGAWTEEQASKIRTAETLASAVGGTDLDPMVGLVDLEPGDSVLLCSDGLTKHVSDEEIASALSGSDSAEATVRGLIDRALAAGGTDNVTVIVARASAAQGS